MARGVALAPERSALAQAPLILGMEGGAPLDQRQDARQRLLVVDEQIAGGGAHEDFDARGAGELFEGRKLLDIVARGADEKGEVAMHAPAPARDLGGERLGAHRCGLRVRHLEDGGDAAQHRRPAAGFQILFMLEPRLAEMHLGVDDARQHMQAGGIEGLAGGIGAEAADRRDAAVPDANIGEALAGMADKGCTLDEEIEGFGQDEAFTSAGARARLNKS